MYAGRVWEMPAGEKVVYISFDDGPEPTVTPQVLDILQTYNAKATFFCVGDNVRKHPELYTRILQEGHTVGNHTMHHLNGSNVKDLDYMKDIREAKKFIDSKLFRPPYGRISSFLAKQLDGEAYQLKIIMWSVLSGDFDPDITAEACLHNVTLNGRDGSIVVFHDSKKAAGKMLFALPKVLDFFTKKGFSFKAINANQLVAEQQNEIKEN